MEVLSLQGIPGQPVPSRKWYQLWWDIWKRPREEAFQRLLKEGNHSRNRGLAWMFVASIILSVYFIIFAIPNVRDFLSGSNSLPSSLELFLIVGGCSIIFIPVVSLTGLLALTAFLHQVAKIFSGYGQWGDLLICLSAVVSPYLILTTIVNSIDVLFLRSLGLIFISILVYLTILVYALILMVNALKAAENMETKSAIATLFVPGVILSVLGLCCSGLFLTSLANLGSGLR